MPEIYSPTLVKTKVSNEYHVASFVAHAQMHLIESVTEEILATEGAEIHAISKEGKVVFTLEASSQKKIGFLIDQLKHHIGLFSLSPVYHQFVTEELLSEGKG